MQDTHQAIDLNINFKVAGDVRPESEEQWMNNQDQHTVNHQSIIQSLTYSLFNKNIHFG